jgi:hypothetical protein
LFFRLGVGDRRVSDDPDDPDAIDDCWASRNLELTSFVLDVCGDGMYKQVVGVNEIVIDQRRLEHFMY